MRDHTAEFEHIAQNLGSFRVRFPRRLLVDVGVAAADENPQLLQRAGRLKYAHPCCDLVFTKVDLALKRDSRTGTWRDAVLVNQP
ncbi:MAG TPA: hypothetical protein VHB97_15275, partial [Polyangia bacterium]|nr:hypothetical protein [Polyangia bacterium]